MGKEYTLSTSWLGHVAQQYPRQGWQQMFANTCILKHSLTTVLHTKSWKCNSTAGFPWLVFPTIFKKCWELLWRLCRNSFESTTGLFIVVIFLIHAHVIGNPSVIFSCSLLSNKARTSCELVSARNSILYLPKFLAYFWKTKSWNNNFL